MDESILIEEYNASVQRGSLSMADFRAVLGDEGKFFIVGVTASVIMALRKLGESRIGEAVAGAILAGVLLARCESFEERLVQIEAAKREPKR